jgi:hypothetical protein
MGIREDSGGAAAGELRRSYPLKFAAFGDITTMLDLKRYLSNPFDSKEISIDELVAFTADHLGKLTGQNPGGVFNEAIAATDALFTALSGTISAEDTAGAIRQARTAATTAKREAIFEKLSQLEGLIHARFPRTSATYVELLPGGLKEFREATLDALNGKLVALLARLAPYAATIGTADVAGLTTLQGEWATLRGEHVTKKGVSTDAAGNRREAADALREQLFDNLLAIARHEKGQPEKLGLYMQQSLLEDATQAAEEPAPATPA